MQWVATQPFEAALREVILPNLGSLEHAGAALLKRSLTRSVHRMTAGGTTVFVKHHKVRSLKERLKYIVMRSRASAEWSASLALNDLGIPAARSVAFGERRVAGVLTEAVLISEAIEEATPLSQALKDADADAKAGLLADVAKLVRKAHDCGVLHRDLHGGNILLAAGGLFFIDLHRMTIGRPVSKRTRIRNLGHLLAFLGDDAEEYDCLAFVRAYLGPDAAPNEVDPFARDVEDAARQLLERRHASRTKRCIKRSTGFRIERRDGMTIRRRADFAPELVSAAIARHKEAAADETGGRLLKADRRARVTAVDLDAPDGKRTVCVKEFIRCGALQRLGDLFRGSRARTAWVGSNACRVRGISTPVALAMADAGPRSYFISEFTEGARQFNDYAADHGRPAGAEAVRRWRRFVLAAADFVRLLHSHRLLHRDLSAKNLLVRERADGWDFFLLDLSDVRPGRAASLPQKIKNLGQLDQIYVMPSRTDRLRFYRRTTRGRPEFDDRGFLIEIDAMSRARHQNWLDNGGGRAILEERKQQGKPT